MEITATEQELSGRQRHWGLYDTWRRCPSTKTQCPACVDDPDGKPHGPYFKLVRSSPELWPSKQELYIGKLTETEVGRLRAILTELDEKFPAEKPRKSQVMDMIRK